MNSKISAYIIHNNCTKRKVIREEIKNLLESLKIKINFVSNQKVKKINYSNFFLKYINIRILLNRELFNTYHKSYLFSGRFNFYVKNIIYSFLRIIKIIFNSKDRNNRNFNHNVIEKIVRDKHIKAWKLFLKSDSDYIIVFEDDSICQKNSKKRLNKILKNLSFQIDKNIYLDLAGGYKLSDILPVKNNIKNKICDIYIKNIYTNTACTYLLSRNLVIDFIKILSKDNFSKDFPIDYLMNYLGFKSSKKAFSGHFVNPIFTHGSFKDNVESWQNYND